MIDNLKKAVDAIAEGQTKYKLAMEDGKFDIPKDVFPFFGLLISLPDLYDSGPQMWIEIKNGTHPDQEEFEAYIRSKDFGTVKVETVITKITTALISNIQAIDATLDLLKGDGGASDPA